MIYKVHLDCVGRLSWGKYVAAAMFIERLRGTGKPYKKSRSLPFASLTSKGERLGTKTQAQNS